MLRCGDLRSKKQKGKKWNHWPRSIKNHIATLQERIRDAGALRWMRYLFTPANCSTRFLDDHPYPFKVNPQFKAWVPVTQVPNCWLLVDGVNKPKLWSLSAG